MLVPWILGVKLLYILIFNHCFSIFQSAMHLLSLIIENIADHMTLQNYIMFFKSNFYNEVHMKI